VPALLVGPELASAAYRPSLAEFKGYGGSPVIDEMNEAKVSTELSFAQLLANSIKMKEEALRRPLTEDEIKELEVCVVRAALGHPSTRQRCATYARRQEKVRKFYPDAK